MNNQFSLKLRKAFRIATPFLLVSAVLFVLIVSILMEGDTSAGWAIFPVAYLFCTMLVLVVGDFILRVILNENAARLWIVEVIIVMLGFWILPAKYYSL